MVETNMNNDNNVEEKKPEVNERTWAMVLDFSKLANLVVSDLKKKDVFHDLFRRFPKEKVAKFLERPVKYEKQLRDVSGFLYDNSMHYKRLILYFSNMLTFDYVLKPLRLSEDVDTDKLKKAYRKMADQIDVMNIKHEFNKIAKICFREDVFYGYELSTKDSYSIKKLNPDLCEITSLEDSCYNFAFDFSYFDKQPDELEHYPEEFKKKYKIYKKDKNEKTKWQELDSENTICIKLQDDIDYAIPMFVGLIADLMDIQDYKLLQKSKEEIGVYKIILQKIPMKKDSGEVNDFLMDIGTAMSFHKNVVDTVPDQIGVITTPMETNEISFERDRAEFDSVTKSISNYWNSAGINQHLFSTDNTSSAALTKSIVTDEMICFSLLKQFQRWMNRKIKFIGGNFKFGLEFLLTTIFNWEGVFQRYLKAAEFGLPVRQHTCATLGLTPNDILNMNLLEINVLELDRKFIPLQSSHVQSGSPGRPKEEEDELTEEGIKSRDKGYLDDETDE